LACFAFDGDTARILTDGAPEKEELDCVFAYLEHNNLIKDSAIDVGANYGIHSLRFAEHYNHVYSFEPHPAIFRMFEFNVEYNNKKNNISAFNYGLSDKKKTLTLYDYKDRNIGGSTFEEKYVVDSPDIYSFECALKTLDSHTDIKNQKIGLLKIDTEGHELSVLNGAKSIIENQKPVILMEDWLSRNGQESEAIQFLRHCGYKHFLVPKHEPRRKLTIKNKILREIQFLVSVFTNIHQYGMEECDFSEPSGYDLIVAHT